jgi:hypothetical protein
MGWEVGRMIAGLGAALVMLAACGGGGGDSDSKSASAAADKNCSDFQYQQDAQAWHNTHPTDGLDADHDGVACESLPARPTSTAQPPSSNGSGSPAGLWAGSTNTGRTVTGLVLSDGTYYVLYSAAGNASSIAGVIQGTGTTSASSFTSFNARDFNLEGLGVSSGSVHTSFVVKQSLTGTVAYSQGTSVSFTATYDGDWATTPTLARLAGSYSGQVALSQGVQGAVVTVSATGAVTGAANGCSMTGMATPRSDGNAYDITIRFGASPCFFANQSLSGIAYLRASTGRLYAAAANAGRTDGVLFTGAK